jgi:membrane-associated phospholipid phosphatase
VRRAALLRAAASCAVACGVAAPVVRRRLRLPPLVVSALAWQAPAALAVAVPPSSARATGMYTLQMWAYTAHYQMPADDSERLRRRVRVRYPIAVDRAIGLGEVPTVRLQRALGQEGRVLPHDLALTIVHWLWYAVPHATLAYVLLRHPERFPRSAGYMASVYDLGLVVYWGVPTAPPWWAGEVGQMPRVRRIMVEVGERVWGRYWTPLYDGIGGNPFAAMPSLHYATSHAAARILSDAGRVQGALGWSYALTIGFALVYLGEHYVADLVAGLALAEGARRVAPWAEPAARMVVTGLRWIELEAAS